MSSYTCAEFHSHTALMKHEYDFKLVPIRYRGVVGIVSDLPDLGVHSNHMHIFVWILSSYDDILHMC